MEHPPWLHVAAAETGVASWPVGQCNPRITQYNNATRLKDYDDKIAWCSSFMNWCFAQVGIEGTGSALARSWLTWGQALDPPRVGCIAVLHRGDPLDWRGHVGFYLRADAERVVLLGGNQLDSVREHDYPLSYVLQYRWPLHDADAKDAT